jgi:hypothetical protein
VAGAEERGIYAASTSALDGVLNSMPPAISLVKRHKCRAPAAVSTAWLRLSAADEGPPAVRRLWSATGPRSQRVEGKGSVQINL